MGNNKKHHLKRPPLNQGKNLKVPNEEEGSTNNLTPHFSFEHLQKGFKISDCSKEQQQQLATRLEELSSMTWNQIILSPRHGLGLETISHSSIKPPTEEFKDKRLLSIRFAAKNPMVGFRQGRVFYFLWLDHNFSVYSH